MILVTPGLVKLEAGSVLLLKRTVMTQISALSTPVMLLLLEDVCILQRIATMAVLVRLIRVSLEPVSTQLRREEAELAVPILTRARTEPNVRLIRALTTLPTAQEPLTTLIV